MSIKESATSIHKFLLKNKRQKIWLAYSPTVIILQKLNQFAIMPFNFFELEINILKILQFWHVTPTAVFCLRNVRLELYKNNCTSLSFLLSQNQHSAPKLIAVKKIKNYQPLNQLWYDLNLLLYLNSFSVVIISNYQATIFSPFWQRK